MAYTKQDHYDAWDYVSTFSASSFENRLMDLLAVSDSTNAAIIESNWGHIIKRMANDYRTYIERKGMQ